MSEFLSIDDSIKFAKENPQLLTNDKAINDKKFTKSYFKSFSGSNLLIRASDGSDFASKFDKANMEWVCYAIPSDFKVKQKVNKEFSEEIIKIEEKSSICHFDNISEEAIMLGCEDYKEEDFLPYRICKELWKLGIKSNPTGWAYYSSISLNKTQSKNRITPIKARPLLNEKYKSTIVKIDYFSPVYLKYEYPALAEISEFKTSKMSDCEFKYFIQKIVKNNDPYYKLVIDRIYGKNTKRIIFYVKESIYSSSAELKECMSIIRDNDPLEINYEAYFEDNGNRIILPDNYSAIAMLDEVKRYFKNISNGAICSAK